MNIEKEINQERREKVIKNTAGFREALDNGKLQEAEEWLKEVSKLEKYDDRQLDHRQRELFQAYNKAQDWAGAKRIIEDTQDQRSKEGRKSRLEELSGKKYEEI